MIMRETTVTPIDGETEERSEEGNEEKKSSTHTDWHVVLGGVQQPWLIPVEITVEMELLATQKPPRIDILLLRRKGKFWTPEQQARLPDGIRQSGANHILCEFKYTQSVNKAVLLLALLYDQLYRTARRLKRHAVQTFVISARTPQPAVLAHFGYTASDLPGVYRSQQEFVNVIDLLVLNELSTEPHNVFFKCFASHKKQRDAAFAVINQMDLWHQSPELWTTISGLQSIFQRLEGGEMQETTLTPEYLRKLGEGMRQQILATVSPEDVKKMGEGMRQQILATVSPEDVKKMGEGTRQQILAALSTEERLAGLAPQERLAGLAPQERLAGLDPEVIEEYLRQQQGKDASTHSRPAKTVHRKPKKKAVSAK
jgi:hypothetical protein